MRDAIIAFAMLCWFVSAWFVSYQLKKLWEER